MDNAEEIRVSEDKRILREITMKLTVTEKRVLRVMIDQERRESNVCTFDLFEIRLGITRRAAKLAVRKLARKGLAEHGPYWNEDGMLGGTGYSLTAEGVSFATSAELENE